MPFHQWLKLFILTCLVVLLTAPAPPPLQPASESVQNDLWSAFKQRMGGDAVS
ncbi:MAG: hypothetical protein KatS3mg046_781 [Bellilinea sp.]|nr:MAG: hypothetical protein KatS3mg046_781 [Bellilinea sp.]